MHWQGRDYSCVGKGGVITDEEWQVVVVLGSSSRSSVLQFVARWAYYLACVGISSAPGLPESLGLGSGG